MKPSILIVVTHLLGVGHLARAAALARGFVAAGHEVTLVSGGRAAPLIGTEGMAFVQLPPVQCRGTDFANLLDAEGAPIDADYRVHRIEILLAALREARPKVLITETFPFGRRQLAGEFEALLEAAAGLPEPPLVLSSIRDVLNPPAKAARVPEAEARLASWFDGVLVHGDAAITPLDLSWPVSAGLRPWLDYTGCIADTAAEPVAAKESGEILVSGGGGTAGLPLFRAALGAARLLPDLRWRILVGHGVADGDFDGLRAAAPPNAIVERARKDFLALLAGCAVSVSQAGYNTMIDLAMAGCRAVLVPFEAGREQEQFLRATRLAELGRTELLREGELSGSALAEAVRRAQNLPPPSAVPISLDGIAGTHRALSARLERRQAVGDAWRRLGAALDGLRQAGKRLDFWWRDDDAIAPSSALDRLLTISRDSGVPVGLAVIPDDATPGLAERLAGEDGVLVLTHGFAHRNHAPVGAKKCELGHRPAETMLAELDAGRKRLEKLFGARALPVLVPPWNRIDPDLLGTLAQTGFAGLSVYGTRQAVAGLVVANTHIDPIDWQGTRSLADPIAMLDRLSGLIDAMDHGDAGEPIGLLTHHLIHDAWVWAFVERLLGALAASDAVRFLDARAVFCIDKPAAAGTLHSASASA